MGRLGRNSKRINSEDEELGYEEGEALFRKSAEKSPEEICEQIAQTGEDWANGREHDDDVVFVVLKAKA